MTLDAERSKQSVRPSRSASAALVVRSVVPAGLNYPEYKPYLRHDFFYSCSYCTIAESEAEAVRLTIDHYEPQTAREDLVHDYHNLMYCCECCNSRKGNRCPPESARKDGYRFFRPDQDFRHEHFERKGREVTHKTNVGFLLYKHWI